MPINDKHQTGDFDVEQERFPDTQAPREEPHPFDASSNDARPEFESPPRFIFHTAEDVRIVLASLDSALKNTKGNVETALGRARDAYGSSDYDRAMEHAVEGLHAFHKAHELCNAMSQYYTDKWGEYEDPHPFKVSQPTTEEILAHLGAQLFAMPMDVVSPYPSSPFPGYDQGEADSQNAEAERAEAESDHDRS